MDKVILKGITWNHSRGITPLLASAQRFHELHDNIEIQWVKRSLQEFADFPIEKLTKQYDLLIIDHPWTGRANATNCVLPLEQFLPESFLKNMHENSTGNSFLSYYYEHQWAIPIDAATPVASYRKDLLQKHNVTVPKSWEELIELTKEGKVAAPAIPVDLLMNFYMFCIAYGKEPFENEEEVTDQQTGCQALELMREFYSLISEEMFGYNPIAVAEAMSSADNYWYCPFAYGYSNYSRLGYARHLLTYSDLIELNQKLLRSTIGGTGLSISAFSEHKTVALQYLEMVTTGLFQSTLYVENGGQPAHLSAWISDHANGLTNNFFKNTLSSMERGYTRPRYNGYLHFQDQAGQTLHHYSLHGGSAEKVLREINNLYKRSLQSDHTF